MISPESIDEFHQTFVIGASWDIDGLELLGFEVKGQIHIIAAEASSI